MWRAAGHATAFSVLWVVVEHLGSRVLGDTEPLQVVWMRYATHLAILLVAIAPRRGLRALIHTEHLLAQLGRSLLMLAMPLGWIAAVRNMPGDDAISIIWLGALIGIPAAGFLGREWPPRWIWGPAGAAYAGAVLVLSPGPAAVGSAAVFALGAAAAWGVYLGATRVLRVESTTTNLWYTAFGVFVPLTVAMPFVWRWPTPRGWLILVAIGAVGLLALYVLDRALHERPVAWVAPFLLLQPTWELCAEVLLRPAARPGVLALAGALLSLGASVALVAAGSRPRATPAGAGPPAPAREP